MDFLFLVGLGIFFICKAIYDSATTNRKGFTKEELDAMHNAVIGKSKKEVRKIQDSYKK